MMGDRLPYVLHQIGSELSAIFHQILYILAGNDVMHWSSGEFEIQPDPTTN